MKKLQILAALGLALPSIAMAQAPAPPSHSGAKPSSSRPNSEALTQGKTISVTTVDRQFMWEAAQSGHVELQASQLALNKATDPAVKEFARHMVEDHTQANTKLAQVAQSKGVSLPSEPSAAHKTLLKSLGGQTGTAFDKYYMAEFGVKAHQQTVGLFRKQAESGQNSDVKTFAQQTLPTLEKHLQTAVGMAKNGAPR